MERLPLLGSDEHKAWCREADKGVHGDNYIKHTKPKRERAKYVAVARNIASDEIKARTLELWDTGKYRQDDVTRIIYKETGFYLTKSSLKNWVWLRNKERRDAKPQN